MPPKHIAQTSTEVKKAYKKNGPGISDRTHKQLQRGYELERRAAREREAEQRRKLAKEKRNEREKKEEQIRKQIGVGLATQLIGYSHTQANLKKGMEAFLGIDKKKQEEERRRKEKEKQKEDDLARKLEAIAQDIEKEPFDEDDDIDDAMMGLPVAHIQDGEGWVDDELDDDTLLEVHDLIMSDPIEEPSHESMPVRPCPATAPPTPQKQTSSESRHTTDVSFAQLVPSDLPNQGTTKEEIDFTRTHGPVNRTVESALERLPGEVIELLSQDTAAISSGWAPAQRLLYKLSPIGLPPHRLRVKIGCVVVCLRDLNTSSQLSKSQHVQILRVENERLECLTLDGQLAGTKTVITRVTFPAKYRNDDNFPFTRNQYPVRVATDYTLTDLPRDVQVTGFKLPSINGKMRPPSEMKRPTPPASKPKSQTSLNPSFKLPGLPASKIQASTLAKPDTPMQAIATTSITLDGWDDFLESGTQIARELSEESAHEHPLIENIDTTSAVIEPLPPLSTQDLNFSLDDLDDEPSGMHARITEPISSTTPTTKVGLLQVSAEIPSKRIKPPPSVKPGPLSRTANIRRINPQLDHKPPVTERPQKVLQSKFKRPMMPPPKPLPPTKKPCAATPTISTATQRFSDFGLSTQEVTSFLDDDDDDDDNLAFGTPPIAV